VTSSLADAFGHHTWATLRILDVCADLSPDQLETTVPGTYGSILDTLRHTVGSDAFYLLAQTDGRRPPIDEDPMDIAVLRHEMEVDGEAWASLVAEDLDPDEVVVQHRADGSETHAPRGIRLAQALHHGTDHRSQICTALTSLGVEAPAIDVWDFAETQGRLLEVPPTS
jgi:uncharacterized damage-inducible protein DinB